MWPAIPRPIGAGQYRFDLLPSGTYEVRVTLPGFATATYENVGVSVARPPRLTSVFRPARKPKRSPWKRPARRWWTRRKTDVSLPITTSRGGGSAVERPRFRQPGLLAPGARPVNSYDPTKNRIGVFAVNGSSGRNVNVTVNGIDDKDNTVGGPVMQLPLEAVAGIQDQHAALLGRQRPQRRRRRSTSITKSGTNQFHGSLYFFDRNQALNATTISPSRRRPGPKPDYSRQQFGGSIGGPVRKDKDFLFFALEREREADQHHRQSHGIQRAELWPSAAGLPAQPRQRDSDAVLRLALQRPLRSSLQRQEQLLRQLHQPEQ